jgi:hypothetical protein
VILDTEWSYTWIPGASFHLSSLSSDRQSAWWWASVAVAPGPSKHVRHEGLATVVAGAQRSLTLHLDSCHAVLERHYGLLVRIRAPPTWTTTAMASSCTTPPPSGHLTWREHGGGRRAAGCRTRKSSPAGGGKKRAARRWDDASGAEEGSPVPVPAWAPASPAWLATAYIQQYLGTCCTSEHKLRPVAKPTSARGRADSGEGDV